MFNEGVGGEKVGVDGGRKKRKGTGDENYRGVRH